MAGKCSGARVTKGNRYQYGDILVSTAPNSAPKGALLTISRLTHRT